MCLRSNGTIRLISHASVISLQLFWSRIQSISLVEWCSFRPNTLFFARYFNRIHNNLFLPSFEKHPRHKLHNDEVSFTSWSSFLSVLRSLLSLVCVCVCNIYSFYSASTTQRHTKNKSQRKEIGAIKSRITRWIPFDWLLY